MPLFFFISGYFYKESNEKSISKYLIYKCRRLLLPAFAWNMFYGLAAWVLRHKGFQIGLPLSFYTVFTRLFTYGNSFRYNLAIWFVPALFLVEMTYISLRKILRVTDRNRETAFALLCLAGGLLAIAFSHTDYNFRYILDDYNVPAENIQNEFAIIPVRTMFCLPFYGLGRLYCVKLEEYMDTVKLPVYFGAILLVQFTVALLYGRVPTMDVNLCQNLPWSAYITAMTGIAFWLRISRILAPILKNCRMILYLGQNTWSVMMHHIFFIFIMKAGVMHLERWFSPFDAESYKTYIWYMPLPFPQFKLIYAAGGIGGSLLFKYIREKAVRTRK